MNDSTTSSHPDREPQIKPRRLAVSYEGLHVERHWAGGDAFRTAWLNAYTVTIPDGEGFIIDTMREFLPQVEDPDLRREIKGFMGQESTHSQGHARFRQVLEQQGYRLGAYDWITHILSDRLLKPTSTPMQRLATVVGIERINELIAEITLGYGTLVDAPPQIRALYQWHLAEEIEHKCVAFDLYQAVGGSRFWLIYGVVTCLFINLNYLFLATGLMLWQDRALHRLSTWRSAWRYFFTEERFLPRVVRGVFEALRRGFHPSQTDNMQLARRILSSRVIKAEAA